MAEKFQKKYKFHTKYDFKDKSRANEFEFWSLIEDPLCNLTLSYFESLIDS